MKEALWIKDIQRPGAAIKYEVHVKFLSVPWLGLSFRNI